MKSEVCLSALALRMPPWTVMLTAIAIDGCSGGNATDSGSRGGGTTSTTPDMGTLVSVDGSMLFRYQYQIKNTTSGMVLGRSRQSQAEGANIVQESSTSSADSMWHLPSNVHADGRSNIENMLTHQIIGLSSPESNAGLPSSSASSSGAQAGQYSDTGTDDGDWMLYKLTDGSYLIKNHYSGLYLQDHSSNTTTSATIDQGARAATGTGCSGQEWTLVQSTSTVYPMPVAVQGTCTYVHDPNLIQDPSTHLYWLYGTHQTIAYCTDLATLTLTTGSTPYGNCASTQADNVWLTAVGHCVDIGLDFASRTGLQTPPSDNNGADVDVSAPDVMYVKGMYYQYYAIPVEPHPISGCTVSSCQGGEAIIGLSTSTCPYGPWTDNGWVVGSWRNTSTPISGFGFANTTTYNATDPEPFVDVDGNWWLSLGSWFDGMHIIALDPTTSLPSATDTKMHSAASRYWGEEGVFICPHVVSGTRYYDDFASINPCCSSASTYRIVVGRSCSPTRPFLDRGGHDMANNGGAILLSTHDNIVGPGGVSIFTDTATDGTASQPTLVYQYYDRNQNGTPTLGINRLGFISDGRPYVK